jgi:hypothetical protein
MTAALYEAGGETEALDHNRSASRIIPLSWVRRCFLDRRSRALSGLARHHKARPVRRHTMSRSAIALSGPGRARPSAQYVCERWAICTGRPWTRAAVIDRSGEASTRSLSGAFCGRSGTGLADLPAARLTRVFTDRTATAAPITCTPTVTRDELVAGAGLAIGVNVAFTEERLLCGQRRVPRQGRSWAGGPVLILADSGLGGMH